MKNKNWWKAVAQTALATIGTTTVLTSIIKGTPEVNEEE